MIYIYISIDFSIIYINLYHIFERILFPNLFEAFSYTEPYNSSFVLDFEDIGKTELMGVGWKGL